MSIPAVSPAVSPAVREPAAGPSAVPSPMAEQCEQGLPTRSVTPWDGSPGAFHIRHHIHHASDMHTHTLSQLYRLDGPAHVGIYPNDEDDHLITMWISCAPSSKNPIVRRLDGPAHTESNGRVMWQTMPTDAITTLDPPDVEVN